MMDSGTILIVDDEPEVRRIVKEIVLESGASPRVIEASDGAEARRKIINEKISVLITDLKMSGMTGQGLLRELAMMEPEFHPTSILVLSAYSKDIGFQPLGDVTFIDKPADPDAIARFVREALRVKGEEEKISLLGLKYLRQFVNATVQILSVTFGVEAIPTLLPQEGLTQEHCSQAYLSLSGKKYFGIVRVVLEDKLLHKLMEKTIDGPSPAGSAKISDAAGELVNQVCGIGKAHLYKDGIKVTCSLPVIAVGQNELPSELRPKRPALAYLTSRHGGMKLEVMIEVRT